VEATVETAHSESEAVSEITTEEGSDIAPALLVVPAAAKSRSRRKGKSKRGRPQTKAAVVEAPVEVPAVAAGQSEPANDSVGTEVSAESTVEGTTSIDPSAVKEIETAAVIAVPAAVLVKPVVEKEIADVPGVTSVVADPTEETAVQDNEKVVAEPDTDDLEESPEPEIDSGSDDVLSKDNEWKKYIVPAAANNKRRKKGRGRHRKSVEESPVLEVVADEAVVEAVGVGEKTEETMTETTTETTTEKTAETTEKSIDDSLQAAEDASEIEGSEAVDVTEITEGAEKSDEESLLPADDEQIEVELEDEETVEAEEKKDKPVRSKFKGRR
ncbi:MAG: hypothetical protein HRU15_20855, partial [Planctomycetes bacterium]|nr:hypothetical protein [Planctomycetota bacterium]